jgi:hypothetical protein
MSAAERRLSEKVLEAVELLEGHDDAEYEALEPQAKANYQEALEFLSRLEASLEEPPKRTDGGGGIEEPPECDLASTLGRDEALAGPFGPEDLVIYDPEEPVVAERWISMEYGATIPFNDAR